MSRFDSKTGEYMIKELKGSEIQELTSKEEFSVVFIYAPWCKVCESFKLEYDSIAEQNSDISFFKVNSMEEDNQEYCLKVDFESIPYFAIHHNGLFIGGETGGNKDILTAIIQMIRQFREQQLQGPSL